LRRAASSPLLSLGDPDAEPPVVCQGRPLSPSQPLARTLGGPGSAGTRGLSRKPDRRTTARMGVRPGATDPSTKHAALWQRKRSRPPLPGIREPGPYARDQVREETRTHRQQCKKRAAGLCQKTIQSLAATLCGRPMEAGGNSNACPFLSKWTRKFANAGLTAVRTNSGYRRPRPPASKMAHADQSVAFGRDNFRLAILPS
jgi:hypothetical protein